MDYRKKLFSGLLMAALGCFAYLVTPLRSESQNDHPVVAQGAALIKIAEGLRYTEGPAWGKDGKVYFTDQASSRILMWSPEKGLEVFRVDTRGPNGLVFTAGGDLVVCETGARSVIAIALDGKETMLADSFEGKKLNAPNDACIDAKGGIYFSDNSMRSKEVLEQAGDHIYYITPDRSKIVQVTSDLLFPDGVAVNPTGDRLYVTDPGLLNTYVYTVNPDGTLKDKKIFADEGWDGVKVDEAGNVYITTSSNHVSVYDPAGKRIDEIPTPAWPSNLCFGGKGKRTLFITVEGAVYSIGMINRGR